MALIAMVVKVMNISVFATKMVIHERYSQIRTMVDLAHSKARRISSFSALASFWGSLSRVNLIETGALS